MADNRVARATLVVAGALMLAGAVTTAGAQRTAPRPAVGSPQPSHHDGDHHLGRGDDDDFHRRIEAGMDRQSIRRRFNAPVTVIYLPSDADAAYENAQPLVTGYQQGAYYSQGGYAGAYVAYGRGAPAGVGTMGPMSGAPGYTPDLSGSPYVVISGGMMLADLPDGERRAFPSCAALEAARGPDGRPRTIFYQPTEYGLVLREGQRGRVQGTPPAGTNACYGIDSFGRVALQY